MAYARSKLRADFKLNTDVRAKYKECSDYFRDRLGRQLSFEFQIISFFFVQQIRGHYADMI